jgi:hypothetical protein
MLSRVSVTVESIWIGDRTYGTLKGLTASNCNTIVNSHSLHFVTSRTKLTKSLGLNQSLFYMSLVAEERY